MLRITLAVSIGFSAAVLFGCVLLDEQPQDGRRSEAPSTSEMNNWREAEQGIFTDHIQLTFGDRFVKAGESYFSPDDKRIIFQAVEVPPKGEKPDEIYAMFVADVKREGGRITGIDNIKRLSPKGSANTCGWFHPSEPNVVIFA